MSDSAQGTSPAVEANIYHLYREYFNKAERKRRWNLEDDIPWASCNPNLNPAFADVVESFCIVELFLPDYIGKILPLIRGYRGRAWFAANWGYEESKHSLALGDWLIKSGQRTAEELEETSRYAVDHQWNLPMDNVRGMVCYSMVQELATWLHYRNLRKLVSEQDDPALHVLLGYVAVDERAHFDFFSKLVKLHLEDDRPGTLEQLRRVFGHFLMPAFHMLPDGARRKAAVQALGIFDDDVFIEGVYLPTLDTLGVTRAEMRNKVVKKSHTAGTLN
jgi:acyl-[acyl-carrier-protein] desaturase